MVLSSPTPHPTPRKSKERDRVFAEPGRVGPKAKRRQPCPQHHALLGALGTVPSSLCESGTEATVGVVWLL